MRHETKETRAVLREVIDAAETFEFGRVRKDAMASIDQLKAKGPASTRNAQWWGQAGQTALALGCIVAGAMGHVEVGIPCIVGGAVSSAALKYWCPAAVRAFNDVPQSSTSALAGWSIRRNLVYQFPTAERRKPWGSKRMSPVVKLAVAAVLSAALSVQPGLRRRTIPDRLGQDHRAVRRRRPGRHLCPLHRPASAGEPQAVVRDREPPRRRRPSSARARSRSRPPTATRC